MGSVGIQHIDFAAKFSSPLREHVLEPTESRLGRVFFDTHTRTKPGKVCSDTGSDG